MKRPVAEVAAVTITSDASARSDGVSAWLVLAMVMSRLDYCNAALAGLPQPTGDCRTTTKSPELRCSPDLQDHQS